jgi:hypothetical protein
MLRQRVLAPAAWFARHGPLQHDIRIVPPLDGPDHIELRIGHRPVCLAGTVKNRIASLIWSSIYSEKIHCPVCYSNKIRRPDAHARRPLDRCTLAEKSRPLHQIHHIGLR